MTATIVVPDVATSPTMAMTLLRLRTYLYASVASLMLIASLGETLERLVSLSAFALAILAPLAAARSDAGRRIELAVVADLTGSFVIWWSLQEAPVVALLLVLWAVAVTSLLPARRTTRFLLAFAVILEVAKLPISMLERSGWFPFLPAGSDFAEPFTLVVSAGGETVIVVVAALVFRSLSNAQRDASLRAAASEEQLRMIFESPIVPLVLISMEGEVVDVNDAAAALIGTPQERMIGQSWLEVVDEDSRTDFLRFAALVRSGEKSRIHREGRIRSASGAWVWVDANVAHLEGLNGNPDHFLAHLEDITERHAAEEALRASEVQYRTFFERLPVAMYRSGRNGEILDANQALADLLGYGGPEELRGKDAYEMYVDPADRDYMHAAVEEAGFVVGFEYRLTRRDGAVVWVRDSSRVVEGPNGAHFEGALVNVTERREVECQLANRARQQEAVALLGRVALENPDIAIAVHRSADLITEILDVDAAYVIEQDLRGDLTMAASGGDAASTLPDPVLRVARESIATAGAAGTDSSIVRPGGCSVMIPGPETPYGAVVAIGRPGRLFGVDDVTFLRAVAGVLGAAIERSRARDRLENLVASKDEFIASISHEVRTPLTVVVGMADELRDGWQRFNDEEIEELVALLVDQSREMQDLVEDLLVAARADIGKVPVNMQEIELGVEIRHVLTSLDATRSRGVVGPVTPVRAYADPVRFRQVFRNLLTNAFRYGGDVIDIEVVEHESTVAVRVIDDGHGIPATDRDRVFLPYESAHEMIGQPGSVGLGLTVARRLAELMGGTLTYSYADHSVFELSLVKAVEIAPVTLS